jgi:hypothetical protein
MTIETKLRAGLVTTLLAFLILLFFYFENVRKFDEYKIEAEKQIELNHDELFNADAQNGRYELTFDHLNETYPKIGKEMEDWLNNETE